MVILLIDSSWKGNPRYFTRLSSDTWPWIFHIHTGISHNSYGEGFVCTCTPSKANNFLPPDETFTLSDQRLGASLSALFNFIVGRLVGARVLNSDKIYGGKKIDKSNKSIPLLNSSFTLFAAPVSFRLFFNNEIFTRATNHPFEPKCSICIFRGGNCYWESCLFFTV